MFNISYLLNIANKVGQLRLNSIITDQFILLDLHYTAT